MLSLPVRHIFTLVALADSGSFRGAAERLKLSQPAVSSHIRELERHFGVALVQRTTRRVSLTAEGQALAARARRAFQELELASQDVRDIAAVHRGRVVLACIPPMMANVVPQLVRCLADSFPAVQIEIRDVLSKEVELLVDRGDADFGIGPQPKSPALSFNKLMRDYFVAAMPLGHALAGRRSIDVEDLMKYPLVAMASDTNARSILDQATQRLRRPFNPRFELVHNFSVGRLVASGVGVAIVPRTAMPILGAGGLKIAEIKSPRIFRELGVMTRPNYRLSPSAQAVMRVLDGVIKQESAGREPRNRAGALRKGLNY
jgi:LysR family transcriptional regulator, carnitine catabolism transcriptional activator